jgi:hypothetical protein
MPRNITLATATGTIAGGAAVEATCVGPTVVAANTVLRISDIVCACDNVTTFWFATAGFVHILPVYFAAAGYNAITFGTPLEYVAGTSVVIRVISAAGVYQEATWNGILIS